MLHCYVQVPFAYRFGVMDLRQPLSKSDAAVSAVQGLMDTWIRARNNHELLESRVTMLMYGYKVEWRLYRDA